MLEENVGKFLEIYIILYDTKVIMNTDRINEKKWNTLILATL